MPIIDRYRITVAIIAAALLAIAAFSGKHADANDPVPVAAADAAASR